MKPTHQNPDTGVASSTRDPLRSAPTPEAFASFERLNQWWNSTGRSTYQPSMLGSAEISVKGIGAFLLDHLVTTNVLHSSRFAVPRTFVIAPDAVSRSKAKITMVDDRTKLLDAFSRSRVIGASLLEARDKIHVMPESTVIVRSLGMAEGEVGKSAAGIFTSIRCPGSLSAMRSAADKVVASAFSPAAMWINREYGLPDQFPGLLIQPTIRGTHCIFNTARPGYVTMTLRHYNEYWPITEKIGEIGNWPFLRDAPPLELRERVHEAAAILSSGGKTAVEVEMMYTPTTKHAFLLQHRFVTALIPQQFPADSKSIAETKSVVGANTVQAEWIVEMAGASFDTLAGLWLVQKALREGGVTSCAFLLSSEALGRLSGKCNYFFDSVFAPLRLGSAFIEHDGGKGHESSSESHELRLAYDKGAITLYADFDLSAIRSLAQETISPDHALWEANDALYLGKDVVERMAEFPKKCAVRCYRTKRPITIIADEVQKRGVVF